MNKPLHRKIFETLRDRIVHGDYAPETSLSEKALCDEFNVSRTPLREALLRLQDMKLVSVIPRFGTYVTKIDIAEIRSAFEVKTKLEGLAGELAAERITPGQLNDLAGIINEAVRGLKKNGGEKHRHLIEVDARFHDVMYQAADNPILQEFLENLHSRCARLWRSSLSRLIPEEEVIDQMKGVYQALDQRDVKAAGVRMEKHVQYFIEKIKMMLL